MHHAINQAHPTRLRLTTYSLSVAKSTIRYAERTECRKKGLSPEEKTPWDFGTGEKAQSYKST